MKVLKSISNLSNNKNGSIQPVWAWIFRLCGFLAALDSVITLSPSISFQVRAFTENETLVGLIQSVIIIIYLFVVDYSLMAFLKGCLVSLFSAEYARAGAHRKTVLWAALLTLIYCLATTAATILISVQLRHNAASHFIAPPTLDTPPTPSGPNLNANPYQQEIERLKGLRNSVGQNVAAKNSSLANLANSGNGWAKQKLNGQIKAQQSDIDYKINKALKDAAKIEAQQSAARAEEAKAFTAAATAIAKKNEAQIKLYESKTQSVADFLLYFAVGATIIQWYAAIMLALYASGFGLGDTGQSIAGKDISMLKNPNNKPSFNNVPVSLASSDTSTDNRADNSTTLKTLENAPFSPNLDTPAPLSLSDITGEDASVFYVAKDEKDTNTDKKTESKGSLIVSQEALSTVLGNARKYHKRYIDAMRSDKKKEIIEHNLRRRDEMLDALEDIGLVILLEDDGGLYAKNITDIRKKLPKISA